MIPIQLNLPTKLHTYRLVHIQTANLLLKQKHLMMTDQSISLVETDLNGQQQHSVKCRNIYSFTQLCSNLTMKISFHYLLRMELAAICWGMVYLQKGLFLLRLENENNREKRRTTNQGTEISKLGYKLKVDKMLVAFCAHYRIYCHHRIQKSV